ncbi:hypothetical protein SAMN04487865_1001100 [Succinivibrio dextrinosolvens]|uniref:Uncharacterized protein n=1 Tax=Succinivibrio dextrinosolvens TaxID=83771 RepID=A0A662Z9N5_9GAMM|nr:hypothetical protein [Succinivibrio dextrinosolvens]SFJ73880.1 hypothetical protein SAMN04487865_1001100 [Succinivibrio dextrinosolvens]
MLGPNITGLISGLYSLVAQSGAFYQTGHRLSNVGLQNGAANLFEDGFSAHNSNSIYTDSGKVYPLSLALNFIIKS